MDDEQESLALSETWAGTEASARFAAEAHLKILAGPTPQIQAVWSNDNSEGDPELPYMLSMQGDIGVVSIRGPLMNIDSPYARYYGVSTYADIRRAVVAAVTDGKAKAILLDIASGGGAVSGCDDTAGLIASVAKVLPVYAYTDGTMASAAYWLGCSAGEGVYCSRTSEVGSIGILQIMVEKSKMLAAAGYTVKVVRSGKYKALANGMEPFTKDAVDAAQTLSDAVYGIFLGHVASQRGVSMEAADAHMAQGRVFVGQQAVAVGLANAVDTFDGLVSRIGATIEASSRLTQSNFGTYMKTALTEQQLAAIAAGAPQAVAATVEPAPPATVVVEPVAAASVEPAAIVAPAAPAADLAVVAYLQGELRGALAEAATSKASLDSATSALAAANTQIASMSAIVATSVSNMRVALGQPAFAAGAMTPDAILAEHASVATAFKASFQVGGVAAVAGDSTSAPSVDGRHMKRVAATSFKK
jgi:signal peptide peptidase SppA